MTQRQDPVRWGVIGLGGVTSQLIAPAITGSTHSQLVACVGTTPEKTRAFADRFGGPRCLGSIEELAADREVEAIYIATPNADHHRMVLAAARGGKHVLCEKPIALSAAEGREMVAACKSAGVRFHIAFQIRLEEILIRVRELVRTGALGELRAVVFERNGPIRQHGPWRADPRQGGIIFDTCVHLFDQVEWLTGLRIQEVSAYSHPDRRSGVSDDTMAVLGMLGPDCHVVVRASRELPFVENDLRIQGRKGAISTNALRWSDEHVLKIRTAAGPVEERYSPTPIYAKQVEAFAHELRGGPSVLATGEDGIRSTEVASAVLESIATRRSVAV